MTEPRDPLNATRSIPFYELGHRPTQPIILKTSKQSTYALSRVGRVSQTENSEHFYSTDANGRQRSISGNNLKK